MVNRFKNIPGRAVRRYVLINLPGAVALVVVLVLVQNYFGIPTWLLVLIAGLWVMKEIVVFPFVWKSYDPDRPGISGVLAGADGIVLEPLAPRGRVRVRGESWKAECVAPGDRLDRGERVRVLRREGLILLVEPLNTGRLKH